MSELIDIVDSMRRLTETELAQVGANSLTVRLREQAMESLARHGQIDAHTIGTFLGDRDSVRYPTRLVYEIGEMAPHQFAQPGPDYRNPGGIALYVHPTLKNAPEKAIHAIAYMIPVINYGAIIEDDHCLVYGATLLGTSESDYYQKLCDLADSIGANEEALTSHATSDNEPASTSCGSLHCSCK